MKKEKARVRPPFWGGQTFYVSAVVIAWLFPVAAWAFPDMVRHGYTNCISCHTSTAGGNLINEYGRSLSREVLSQPTIFGKPSVEGDEKFLWGLPTLPKGLLLQSDVRVLQLFVESKQASRGRFLIMQVDLDGSYQLGSWRAFGSVGRIEPIGTDNNAKDFVAIPRAGLEYVFTKPDSEQRLALKAGRFMPAYGIGFAEHTFVTRTLLDFNPAQERMAAELAWNNDRAQVVATGIFQQFSGNKVNKEDGGAIQASIGVREKSKVGINYYQTDKEIAGVKSTRRIYGAFSHITFNKDWYALIEVDRPQRADEKWGLVEIMKLGYEVHQGWHLIGVQEYANLNFENPNPKFEAFSFGTEWYPRPHWDFLALYRRERSTAISNNFQDVVWLVAHFYL